MGIQNKNIFEQIETTIDVDTGEVKESKRIITRKVKAESFIRVYLEDLSGLIGIDNKTEYKMLVLLWERAGYNTNEVFLVKHIKKEIAKKIDVSYDHVCNMVSSLKKKGILIWKATGVYILNPKYFFKGLEVERSKMIDLIFRYEIDHTEEAKQ